MVKVSLRKTEMGEQIWVSDFHSSFRQF